MYTSNELLLSQTTDIVNSVLDGYPKSKKQLLVSVEVVYYMYICVYIHVYVYIYMYMCIGTPVYRYIYS